MRIFNTLTRQKEEFVPLREGEARIYACGPTVYNYIHIGNARPLCVFDVLRRYLEWRGYKVFFVQNFTDVDDKIIKKSMDEKVPSGEIARRYIDEYWTDAKGLGVREATVHPKATECMNEIIALVQTLVNKGFAYESGGDVYFRTKRFQEYGKLSHQPLDDLEAGARIDVSEQKEDPVDFALWKKAKPGEPFWASPWGDGRPGWHIECSAMAKRYLGNTIDIHCGGQDLIFPHHENEIAQSECANGCGFARYWMHNGYINVDNKKMSKSLGNFFTVRDVAEKYGYAPIRYLMIASHYRSPINYSVEIIEQNIAALERLRNSRSTLIITVKKAANEEGKGKGAMLSRFKEQFIDAMEDDLNTADALSAVFELTREINVGIAAAPTKAWCQEALALLDELCGVLGLALSGEQESLDSEVEALIHQRTQARKEKDFAKADAIRDRLKEMGIVLEDTPAGVKWHRED